MKHGGWDEVENTMVAQGPKDFFSCHARLHDIGMEDTFSSLQNWWFLNMWYSSKLDADVVVPSSPREMILDFA